MTFGDKVSVVKLITLRSGSYFLSLSVHGASTDDTHLLLLSYCCALLTSLIDVVALLVPH